MRPLIAIATDVVEPIAGSVRAQCGLGYARAVHEAGGEPVFLPPIEALIPHQLRLFDGFVLTGGDDPRMEPFGEPTHPKATPVHAVRQAYETALIESLMARPEIPVLGICLGMQMLALVAGGRLDQHMPDTRANAERHRGNNEHGVVPAAGAGAWSVAGRVVSHHRQAVSEAGSLRVAAHSDDGVIEAVERPTGAFFAGVQWHPERTADGRLGAGVFGELVRAAAGYASARRSG